MKRRQFVKYGTYGSFALCASGCSCLVQKPTDPYPMFDRHRPSLNSRLIIDTHGHFFNGTDLQVSKFVHYVGKSRTGEGWGFPLAVLGAVLQAIVWNTAPSAAKEIRKISSYRPTGDSQLRSLAVADQTKYFETTKNEQTAVALRQLKSAALEVYRRDSQVQTFSARERSILDELIQLDESMPYDSVFKINDSEVEAFGVSLKSVIKFVVEMFQYRYVSANNFLNENNSDAEKVDLTIGHMVDYDWWLNKGKPTKSPFKDQIETAEKLSIASSGLVHAFVPFCPLRMVAWDEGNRPKGSFDPLNTAIGAVLKQGAMGIKLYPPMGFSLSNNQSHEDSLWSNREFLPDIAKSSGIGKSLDDALDLLYRECVKHDIPIMAHSSPSNLSDKAFAELFRPEDWAKPLEQYPKLRTNFGHFGGIGSSNDEQARNRAKAYLEIARQPGVDSRNFLDTGFFSDVLTNPQELLNRIRVIAETSSLSEKYSQIIYGSDWKMILSEKNSEQYLAKFKDLLAQLEQDQILPFTESDANGIIGNNAVRFLGLVNGENRTRAEAFYDEHSVREPTWMLKTARINI